MNTDYLLVLLRRSDFVVGNVQLHPIAIKITVDVAVAF